MHTGEGLFHSPNNPTIGLDNTSPSPVDIGHVFATILAESAQATSGETPVNHSIFPNRRIYTGPEEAQLRTTFIERVESLDLTKVLRLEPGRKTPKGLQKYELQPITARYPGNSMLAAGDNTRTPKGGISSKYSDEEDRLPYLDVNNAIGLAYRGAIVALVGAGMAPNGALRIVQIQGVPRLAKDENPYKSGLYGGFLWRDTLVQAWVEIANDLGIQQMELQGYARNRWRNAERTPGLIQSYDKVAKRMGFIFNERTRDWYSPTSQLIPSCTQN